MGIFHYKPAQEILVPEIKKPIVEVLFDILEGNFNISSVRKLLGAYKSLVKLPYPTVDNVTHHNSKELVRMRDRFLQCELDPRAKKIWAALWNLAIMHIDPCSHYRHRSWVIVEWLVEAVQKGEWEPRPPWIKLHLWKENQE